MKTDVADVNIEIQPKSIRPETAASLAQWPDTSGILLCTILTGFQGSENCPMIFIEGVANLVTN